MSAVLSSIEERGRAIAQLRVPPHSVEAESGVLSGLLLEPGAWDRVGDLLADSDFYRYEHRLVFEAISQLANACKEVDVFTVFEHLKARGKHAECGLPYLTMLSQYAPSAANIRRYAEIVREHSVLRQLVAASDEIATQAFNTQGKSVDKILDEAETKIFEIALSRKGGADDEWQAPDRAMVEFLDAMNDRAQGRRDFVPTGLRDLDEKLDGGMRPGEVIVIAGRPSMGKSALGLSIAENAAEGGHAVGVLSLEMTKEQLNRRRVAMHSHVSLHKIKRPERMEQADGDRITRAVDVIRGLPVYINEMSAPTINQVRTKARNLKRRHNLRVLVLDYIGLMEGTDRRADRRLQLGEVSRGMKALAKELGISVLLLAQLNREVEKRHKHRPILSDLRESGDIEQDADVILFVHRPVMANPELSGDWLSFAEIVIGKQRDGETGILPMRYEGDAVTFDDWPLDWRVPTEKSAEPRAAKGMVD